MCLAQSRHGERPVRVPHGARPGSQCLLRRLEQGPSPPEAGHPHLAGPTGLDAHLAPLPDPTGSTVGQANREAALRSAALEVAGKEPETANRFVRERRELLTGHRDGTPVNQLELWVAILNVVRPANRRLVRTPVTGNLSAAARFGATATHPAAAICGPGRPCHAAMPDKITRCCCVTSPDGSCLMT
jgi:hypothetical protein